MTIIVKNVLYALLLLPFTSAVLGQLKTTPVKHFNKLPAGATIRPDFKKYFDECRVEGAIAIFDNKKQLWILSDTVNTMQQTLLASTFKIINMLIALETGTIPNEDSVVKWPGKTDTVKYGYRLEIYHDISVKNAFEVSAGWAFIKLAKKIDRRIYKRYLTQCV